MRPDHAARRGVQFIITYFKAAVKGFCEKSFLFFLLTGVCKSVIIELVRVDPGRDRKFYLTTREKWHIILGIEGKEK